MNTPMPKTLLDEIMFNNLRAVSVIGMAKNSGKTVTFNGLVREAFFKDLTLGMTSIGKDGETKDALTNTHKPRVWVPVKSLIATATDVLRKTHLNLEIIAGTGAHTPLGEVLIARTLETGYIELVGPSTNKGLLAARQVMDQEGIDLFLSDGALSRKSLASYAVVDGIILATGAVVGRTIEQIISKTLAQASMYSLQQSSGNELFSLSKQLINSDISALVQKDYGYQKVQPSALLNNGEEIVEQITPDTKALVISGGLVEGLLLQLVNSALEIVVKDATCVFAQHKTIRRFINKGGRVSVLNPINIVAVTVNPVAPKGKEFDSIKLCTELSNALEPIPVYDVVSGRRFTKGQEVLIN